VLNTYRDNIPLGYLVAHMVADSNGVSTVVSTDRIKRPQGLMQVPLRDATRFSYTEKALQKDTTNLQAAAKVINLYSELLHNTYPLVWPTATQDFWCAVRLLYLVNLTSFSNLMTQLTGTKTLDILLAYMTGRTTRLGRWHPRDLKRFATHIAEFRVALRLLDGATAPGYHASLIPPPPGGALMQETQ